MTRISNLPRLTTIDDTGLLVFVNGASEPISVDSGETVSMTFADFKLSVVDQLNTISGPITSTTNAIALFADETGNLLADSGIVFGTDIGDAITLGNVSGNAGLPAVDGSLLTNIVHPDISSLVTGPGPTVVDSSFAQFDGTGGFTIKEGPVSGLTAGDLVLLTDNPSGTTRTFVQSDGQIEGVFPTVTLATTATIEFTLYTGSSLAGDTVFLVSDGSAGLNQFFLDPSGGLNYQDASGQIVFGSFIAPNTTTLVRVELTPTQMELFEDNVSVSVQLVTIVATTWNKVFENTNPANADGYCISDLTFTDAVIPQRNYALDELSGTTFLSLPGGNDGTWSATPTRKVVFPGTTPGLPAIDGSLLLNLPGDITGPSSSVISNIVTWADTLGGVLLDSGTSITAIITNANNISDNQNDIALNKIDITANADAILLKQDKSPNDGVVYALRNGAIIVPDTQDVNDTTDRRYVLDSDLAKLANVPADTSAEIGTKQTRSPVDGIIYGLLDSILEPITIAVIPGLTTALAGKQDISPVDGVTYGLLDGGIVAIVAGGNVVGPISSVDNRIVLFDGITGELIKDSGIIFGTAIGNAIQLVDVSGPALPAVDGSLLTNLTPTTLQESYLASSQPQFPIDATGSVRFKENLNDGSNLIIEGLNFSNATTFSVDGDGKVIGSTFNGVALSTVAGDRLFLAGDGTYQEVSIYQRYTFSADTANTDPGTKTFKYNAATAAATTEIYISKIQNGGLDIGDTLLVGLTQINITSRIDPDEAHLFTLSGIAIDNTTYVTLPVTNLATTGNEQTVNGDISINLIGGAGGGANTFQDIYDGSLTQPQITTSALGAVQIKEGLNNDANLIHEVLNFSDVTTFSVSGAGAVIGSTFNGVALTISGEADEFLAADGAYKTNAVFQEYTFSSSTVDGDPGTGFFRYNNAAEGSTTFIFMSKKQKGGLDIGVSLLRSLTFVNITVRSNSDVAHQWEVTGQVVDASTYVKIPVTLSTTGGFAMTAEIAAIEFDETVSHPGEYIFDSSTADADPGAGKFRLNNATPASATFAFLSKIAFNGLNLANALQVIRDQNFFQIQQKTALGKASLYEVNGIVEDATTYIKIPLTALSTGTIFDDGAQCIFEGNTEPSLRATINLEASSLVLSGGIVSIDSPGSPIGESFSITSGEAKIVMSDATDLPLAFGPFNAQVVTEAGDVIFLFISSVGSLIQNDDPSADLFRTSALLGFVSRGVDGQLIAAAKIPNPTYQNWAQVADIGRFISGATEAQTRIDAGATDTSFQRFEGDGFVFLGNILVNSDDPHTVSMTAANPSTFRCFLFDGAIENVIYSGLGTDTLIDPTVFDDLSGSLIPVPGGPNQSQIIRVFYQPNAAGGAEIRLMQGQTIYDTLTDAINSVGVYFPIIPVRLSSGSLDLGAIVIRSGATDFTSMGDAVFVRASQISGGGGGSTQQDLQDTYNNSTPAQTITSGAIGEFLITDGSGVLTNTVFEVQNNTSDASLSVTGNGVVTAIGFEPTVTGIQVMSAGVTLASVTTIDIPAIDGWIVDETLYGTTLATRVQFPGQLGFTIPNLGVDNVTYLFIDSAGALQTQNTAPTDTQRRANIHFANTVNDTGMTAILLVINAPTIIGNNSAGYKDINHFIGALHGGGAIQQTSDTGTNGLLGMQRSDLSIFQPGVGWVASKTDPNKLSLSAIDPQFFAGMLQTGAFYDTLIQEIDPTQFDSAGTLTTVPLATDCTIQYLFMLTDNTAILLPGQTIYVDLDTALANLGLDRELRVTPDSLTTGAVEMAAIAVVKNCLDLADITKARIVQNSTFGSSASGGITTFKGLTDTPASAGAVNTMMTWDVDGDLQNTQVTSFTDSVPGWFFNDASIAGTGSFFFGFFSNNSGSDTQTSVIMGTNTVNKLGDDNNNIVVLGSRCLNQTIAASAIGQIVCMGDNTLASYISGFQVIAIGNSCAGGLQTGIRVIAIGTSTLAGSGKDYTDCVLIGHGVVGPLGTVDDYINIDQTIQAQSAVHTVVIGGPVNTVPTNLDHSLELASTDQVLKLNVLTTTQEGLITILDGSFWYNVTLNKYRGRENGVTVTFTTS